ncbi:hypothetical protein WA026_000053 [Henosepilachna vigintioctopunctata]|uniref:Uncharacterized protein n=1 Tax=Henosepilachna vigintioctopunctata TaxID=420089 RepID=A0AAW1V4T1_9CUCU
MILYHVFVFSFFSAAYGFEMSTYLREKNVFLRKRRYLDFPEGSNIVITLSLVKAIMVRKPKGYNNLLECDIPFPLPSVKDNLKKYKTRYGRSENFQSKWSDIFDRLGQDGKSCIEKMLCEAKFFVKDKRGSIISNILIALLGNDIAERNCDEEEIYNCDLPYLPDILTKLLKLEMFNY